MRARSILPLVISLVLVVGCAARPEVSTPSLSPPPFTPLANTSSGGASAESTSDAGYTRLRYIAGLIGRGAVDRAYRELRRWISQIDAWLDHNGCNQPDNSAARKPEITAVEDRANAALEEIDE